MNRQLWRIWGLILLVKLLIAIALPFAHDEAYYWFWSLDPQLSYYDHPGMVAWLFRLGHVFAKFGQAERWPLIILGHFSVVFWLDFLKSYLSDKRRLLFLALFSLFPLIGPGSLIATPDVPLLFFWSASFWFFERALRTKSIIDYAGLGLSLGLGFCSKYHIVLFVPLVFIHLWYTNTWRQIKWPFVAVTILVGLVGSLPVLIWNYQHEFVSFTFQLKHGLKKQVWTPAVPGIYIAGQIALLFPLLIYAVRKSKPNSNLNWLKPWIIFPLAFFGLSSLRAPVEGNWTMVAYPAWLALVAGIDEPFLKHVYRTLGIWLVGTAVITSEIFFNWMPIDPQLWKVKEFSEYRDLPSKVQGYEPLYASSYQMASQLSYLKGHPVYKVIGMARRDYFDELPQSMPSTKQYYVVVNHEWSWDSPLAWQGHHKIERIQVHPLYDVLLIQAE